LKQILLEFEIFVVETTKELDVFVDEVEELIDVVVELIEVNVELIDVVVGTLTVKASFVFKTIFDNNRLHPSIFK